MDYFQYLGLDWLAAVFAILGTFYLGSKKRMGFVFFIVASSSGIIFSFLAKSLPLIILNIVTLILNIRGFIKWKK